ncbi:cell division protein FtsQ/DivIB [Bermanella sp. R86510]|uniref:cell division protein FtsQ/DivIB n=1 Tax=unclassified Bermanella TaxID=2627862 RepID=UPI0037CBE9DF
MKGATRNKAKKQWDMLAYLKPVSIAITSISALAAVVIVVMFVANKPVNELKLQGDLQNINKSTVLSQISGRFPAGFITLDVYEIEQALKAHPLIAKANVEKVWPHQLKIELIEETPVAMWNGEHMLSEHGEIIPISLKNIKLPKLNGQNSRLVMDHYLLFNRWSKRHNLFLTELEQGAGWLLKFASGLTIRLDSNTAMKELQKLEIVIERFQLDRVASFDMRYEQGFAVAWKQSEERAQG